MTEQERKRRKERTKYLGSDNKVTNTSVSLSDSERKRREGRTKYLTGNSDARDIYEPTTQTAKTNVSAGDFAGTSKRLTGKTDMRADEEAASLAERFANLPEAQRQEMVTEHIGSLNKKTSTADVILKQQQSESKNAWENEKAEYNRQQAAKKAETVNTPMSEKYNMMTDDELEKSRKETAELLAQREKQTGGKTKQIFELIGAVANDEEYQADRTLEYLREESDAASAETTQRYQDKFYSMSDEERKLVATVNAYSMNDITATEYNGAVTAKEYNAAREALKAKYAYSDDDITAMTYFYNRYANEKRAQKDDINARLAMDEHPFLKSVASVPMGLIGGVAALGGISDSYVDNKRVEKLGIEDQGIDYNHAASRMQRNTQSGRAQFTDTHDWMIGDYDVGDMLYNTALSGLESAAAAAVPGGAVILGVNAGTAKANELAKRGLSSEQSIMGGVAAGAFEALFEQVSIGNITALKDVDAKTIKDVALNIGKSMVTNFSEESATEIASIMYDSIMHGDKSEEAIQIRNLVNSGKYTEEQAKKEVLKGQVLQVIEAGASGALMGAGFGAAGTAGSYIDNAASLAATGATAKKNGMTGAIIAAGQAAPDGSRSKTLADKLAEKQKGKGKVGSYKLGQLAEANAQSIEKSGEDSEMSKKMKDAFNHKLYRELAEVDRAEATNPKIMTELGEATVDGGNFDSEAEKLGEFKGIFKDKDGDNAVKTTDGIEFKVSDAVQKMQNKTVARLYEKTQDMSADAATLFIENWDGESIDEYKRAFDYYYKMGRTGMSVSDIRKNDNLFGNYLTADAQTRIAKAGLSDREFRKGFTDLSVSRKTDRYRFEAKVLQTVGEKRNLEIFVIDEKSEINGTYFAGTNRIVIRRSAEGKLLLRTASHEAFHFIKNQATDDAGKAEVKALEDFVIDALKKNGTDVEAEIARLGAITDGDGNTVYATREDCVEEIVANSMFDAFTNEKFVKKLMNENRSLFGRIADRIKEMLSDIKAAISMLGNTDAAVRALKDDVESLEKINTTFNSLLEKAGEKYRAEHEGGQKNNTAEAVKYSMKEIMITQAVMDKNIEDVTKMESVSNLTGNEFAKSDIGLPKQVEQFFANLNNSVENLEIGDVELTKRGAKDSIAHGIGRKKAVSFAAVPDTIKNGKIIDFQSNWKGRGYDTVVLAAPITIESERYYQGVIVLREKTNQRFYVHEVLTEKESDTSFKTGVGAKHTPGDVSPSLISLLKKIRNVNTQSIQNLQTENVDVKFSHKDTNPAQKQIEILYENRNLKQIISLIDELHYSTVTSNVRLKTKDINLVAKKILKKLQSKYDVNTLTDELAAVYNYMENSESEDKVEEVRKALSNLAIKILDKSEMKDTALYDQYKPVRDFLREQRVYIPSELKKEIEHRFGDFKSFRNILMGKMMHITTTDETAPTLDEVWQQLAEMAPEYFPKDFNEKDMPMQLAAFFEATAPKIVNTYEHYSIDVNEEAAAVAEEFQMEFANVERIKSKHGDYQDLVFKNNQKFIEAKKAYHKELSQKSEKNKAELYENYQKTLEDYRNKRKETEKRRVLRNKIDRIYSYLNRRLVNETDSRNIPENFKKLANAFNGILPDSNNYFSWARFTEFENEYRAMEKGEVFFDDGILQRIIALKEELCSDENGIKMRELNTEQLKELNNIAEHIKHIVQKENELFNDKIKAQCETLGLAVHNETLYLIDHSAQEIPEQKYKGKWKARVRNSVDGFIKGLTKPEYLFASLGSDTMKFLYDEIRKGENIEARIIAEAKEFEQETKRKYNYDPRWKNKNIEIEIGGRKVSMTVESAMALYATSKRKQGLQHLLGGGAVVYTHKEIIKDGKKYSEIKKDVIKEAKRNKEQLSIEEINQRALGEYQKHGETENEVIRKRYKFTEKDIPKIAEALSADQKQYTDAMVDYITNVIGKKRNEVSMKMFGIEKYKEPYYFPIRVDSHFVDKNIGKQEVVSTIKNQSSAKRTSSYAENPIEIAGFTETVNNHIYDSALYCAYVVPISDFKRVFNYRGSEFDGEGASSLAAKEFSVEKDLERANGINAVKQIKDFMIALDSGSRYENLMPLSAKLAARAKKVSVMANLSVVVQQPTAVFRAMLYVDPKHFATLASKADIAEMKKWNGCALKKEIGYFDVNMGRTATDYINEYSPDKQSKKDWSIKDRIENGNIMLTIDRVAGWGATKADEMTWGAIWKACKKQTKAENAELSGDALNEAAAELFQKVISKTQVYDSVFTKPDYMRRKEGFAMLATQFMSEPLTSLNMLAEAVCEARNAKGSTRQNEARKFCGRAFACYMTSLVVNSALKSLVYTMRDDDDDESFLEKYIANVTYSLATEPFGMIPYVKDILSIVQGYDLNRTDVAAFASFKDAIDALGSEKKGAYEKIMAVLKAAGQASGIPLYSVIRDGKAIIDVFNKIVDGVKNGFEPTTGRGVLNSLRETFDYLPLVDAQSDYEQLYNAIAAGDTRHYEKVYNNLIADGKKDGAINAGIASTLAENDSRVAAAYEATANADAATAASRVSELKEAGFSDEVINRALKEHENTLEKAVAEDERIAMAAQARYSMDYDEYERIIKELVAEGYRENIVRNAVDSAKIELETKAYEFAVGDKDMYTTSYDLQNALVNGDSEDVKEVYDKISEINGKSKADSSMISEIKKAYGSNMISRETAEKYLKDYSDDETTDKDISRALYEAKSKTNSVYDKLDASIDNGESIDVEYLFEYGVEEDDIRQHLTSKYKNKLLDKEKDSDEYNALYESLIAAYGEAGYSKFKAAKTIKEWYD